MGKKLVVRLARGAQEGLRWGLVMNYGRSPAPPVGGQHLYHAMGIVQVGGGGDTISGLCKRALLGRVGR